MARESTTVASRCANVVAGDWIVDRVRLVKSQAELACVRRASQIVDAAVEVLVDGSRDERLELLPDQVVAEVHAEGVRAEEGL